MGVPPPRFYHDRSAKELAEIPTGSTVRIHNGKNWPTKAKVIEKAKSPRSYVVETEAGQTLCRNRRVLSKTSERFSRTEADIDFPISDSVVLPSSKNLDTMRMTSYLRSMTTLHNIITQYHQPLRTSVKPPNRYGFKDGP